MDSFAILYAANSCFNQESQKREKTLHASVDELRAKLAATDRLVKLGKDRLEADAKTRGKWAQSLKEHDALRDLLQECDANLCSMEKVIQSIGSPITCCCNIIFTIPASMHWHIPKAA